MGNNELSPAGFGPLLAPQSNDSIAIVDRWPARDQILACETQQLTRSQARATLQDQQPASPRPAIHGHAMANSDAAEAIGIARRRG